MIWIILIAFMLLSGIVSLSVKSKYKRFSRIPVGMTGADIARLMLRENGINDVDVISTNGQLTDHYDPTNKTVNLSHDVFYGNSIMAAAVAAHECGHAVQHAKAYAPVKLRSALVPVVSFASRYMSWLIFIGIIVLEITAAPLEIGIALYALTTLFAFVTLPVEFDASHRALVWMKETGIADEELYPKAQSMLRSAASTYVVAALASLATLLYYIIILLARRN